MLQPTATLDLYFHSISPLHFLSPENNTIYHSIHKENDMKRYRRKIGRSRGKTGRTTKRKKCVYFFRAEDRDVQRKRGRALDGREGRRREWAGQDFLPLINVLMKFNLSNARTDWVVSGRRGGRKDWFWRAEDASVAPLFYWEEAADVLYSR